ncbi:MAG: SAM-dependent methyltransferase [Pseudomonadota bacterium]
MTDLACIIARQIQLDGPMSLANYMQLCLMHPELGYYVRQDPFGAAGDFTTAPEISQMFGELIGLALVQAWLDQGAPKDAILVELGPGRGTLMADLLRAAQAVPQFRPSVHLVETSPALRKRQAETLKPTTPVWHEDLSTLPDAPLLLVANEFFDALPIRQFQRAENGWSERRVMMAGDALTLGLTEPVPTPALAFRDEDTSPGDIVEICPQADGIMEQISTQIEARGGAALIIDYGDWRSLGDTFQALKSHQSVDPFAHPGAADLTAHVDFEALSKAANCAVSRLTTQAVLLQRLGIDQRAQKLADGADELARQAHLAAYQRLTHPAEMGSLFKAIALTPRGAAGMAGFAP